MPHLDPVPGEIYGAWIPQLERRFCFQVTHVTDGKAANVLLEGEDGGAPARFTFGARSGWVIQRWSRFPVPASYELVGVAAVVDVEEPEDSTKPWPGSWAYLAQHAWDSVPASARTTFEEHEAGPDRFVKLRAEELLSGRWVHKAQYAEIAEPVDDLVGRLSQHRFVATAILMNHGLDVVDLSAVALLQTLRIDVNGLRELVLPPLVTSLDLSGTVSPDLVVRARDDGVGISLTIATPLPGLPAASGFRSYGVKQLDLAAVAEHHPDVRTLFLVGAPGRVTGTAALARLTALEELTMVDLYGYAPDELPGPDDLPALRKLDLDGTPADVASLAKKAWKPAVARGVEVSITKPRKAEWLAANLDNPFHRWDDAKAAPLYKALRSGLPKDAEAAVTAYVAGFDKLHAKRPLDTIEREDVMTALAGALADQDLTKAEQDRLFDLADGLRDF